MAEATFEYQLGEYAGRTYLLTARAVPGFDDPAEFAVVVHYNDPDRAETEQVARIDTAHGGVHFDRLYRRDEPKDDLDISFWEAVDRLEADWRTYARGYERRAARPGRPTDGRPPNVRTATAGSREQGSAAGCANGEHSEP